MKLLIFFLAVASAQFKNSTPQVGDLGRYNGRLEENGKVTKFFEETNIVKCTGQDCIVRVTRVLGDNVSVTDRLLSQHVSFSSLVLMRWLGSCEKSTTRTSPGIREEVKVPAGTYKSCRVSLAGTDVKTTVWIANVPFGWVKLVRETKSKKETLELLSHQEAWDPEIKF